MKPFVNKDGKYVNSHEIVTKRREFIMKDYESFKRNYEMILTGQARKKQYTGDWDLFRMYESNEVLPFIDQTGRTITANEIAACRRCHSKVRTGLDTLSSIERDMLFQLKKKKQKLEHELYVLREDKKDEEVGNWFSSKFLPENLNSKQGSFTLPPPMY